MKHLTIEKKKKAIHCAAEYGAERAAKFYNVKVELVKKWIKNKNKIFIEAERRRRYKIEYIKRRYAEGTLIIKSYPRIYRKRIFKHLSRSVKASAKRKKMECCFLSALDFWKLAKRQKLKCAISGMKLNNENMSPDHIIPICKGGNNTIENIQIVDKRINMMKHSLDEKEFVELCNVVVNYKNNQLN